MFRYIALSGLLTVDAARTNRMQVHEVDSLNVTMDVEDEEWIQFEDMVKHETGAYPKKGDKVQIEFRDTEDFTSVPSVMCSKADRKILYQYGHKGGTHKKDQSFNGVMSLCGEEGYSFWTNSFKYNEFKQCIKGTAFKGLSESCTKCMAIGPSYGAINCKSPCAKQLGGDPCSEKCVSCNQASGYYIHSCSGGGTPTGFCQKNKALKQNEIPSQCKTADGIFDGDGNVKNIPAACSTGNE
jgi:hypothetical protein